MAFLEIDAYDFCIINKENMSKDQIIDCMMHGHLFYWNFKLNDLEPVVKKQEYWADPEHEGYNYARFIIEPFVNLFNFIEWEDDEPFKIEEILKDFEVVDNE